MQEERNSYEEICERQRQHFLASDRTDLCARVAELRREGAYWALRHYGRKLGVQEETGEVCALEDGGPVVCYEALNVYALLGAPSTGASFQDDWVPYEELRGTGPFSRSFQAHVVQPFARMFNGRGAALEWALQALGGKKLPWSDVGYELHAFDCIPVRFLFWEGDEEFPAQANLLFDRSATDFIDEKSIVRIALIGLDRIVKAAGIEMDRSAFLIF